MERKIITTLDGSTTIQLVAWDECYHSKKGAIQEAYHVFIKNGLDFFQNKPISILEIGFGTGLNAFITFLEAEKRNQKINYTGIEAYPLGLEEALAMNYPQQLAIEKGEAIFKELHTLDWEVENQVGKNFILKKRNQYFNDINDQNQYDLIYFDAFGYQVQPELWSVAIFSKMFNALKDRGVLVTYAARGVIKRNLKEVGFEVQKFPGPPGKREMMIAFKNF